MIYLNLFYVNSVLLLSRLTQLRHHFYCTYTYVHLLIVIYWTYAWKGVTCTSPACKNWKSVIIQTLYKICRHIWLDIHSIITDDKCDSPSVLQQNTKLYLDENGKIVLRKSNIYNKY